MFPFAIRQQDEGKERRILQVSNLPDNRDKRVRVLWALAMCSHNKEVLEFRCLEPRILSYLRLSHACHSEQRTSRPSTNDELTLRGPFKLLIKAH
jgi:hypothetical protein